MERERMEEYLRLVQESRMLSSNPIVANALKAHREKPDVASGLLLVRNVRGTGDEQSPCGSWKMHWQKDGVADGPIVRPWPDVCSVCDCRGKAEHGAHVRDNKTRRTGIVPLCAEHNNFDNDRLMLLKKGTTFVAV